MWRVVAILALSFSGCVSTKLLDQSFGAGQGRRIIKAEIAYFVASPAGREVRPEKSLRSAPKGNCRREPCSGSFQATAVRGPSAWNFSPNLLKDATLEDVPPTA